MTYTYAILVVSKDAYQEIKEKLIQAEYGQVFTKDSADDRELIDLHGIALKEEP